MKVWLDDLRPAPAGWTWVTNVTQVIKLLESGEVEELSLDHDLGSVDENGRESTGYDVLVWIEERVVMEEFRPPKLSVHSANPAGAHPDATGDRGDRALRGTGASR